MELPLDSPPQPRDPIGAAARVYCQRRHADGSEECLEQGRCNACRETVADIVRAWEEAQLT